MMKRLLIIISAIVLSACKKDFLDERPSTTIAEPSTIELMTKLLDQSNGSSFNAIHIASCDDYYFSSSESWQAEVLKDRNAYIWKADIFEGNSDIEDWNLQYAGILDANVVLESLKKFPPSASSRKEADYVTGWAYFNRAWALIQLVQTFSPSYNKQTANTDLGVPIRLTSNVDELNARSTVEQTYNQIFFDLQKALPLLVTTPSQQLINRPSKAAVFALLARTYLIMREYHLAGAYADSALKIHDRLTDFNTLSKTSNNPFANNINEWIYFASATDWAASISLSSLSYLCVDSTLYDQYNTNDLRKIIYFRMNPMGKPFLKRNNPMTTRVFGGLTTGEMLLIKAEVEARSNNVENALLFINRLLEKRWASGSFSPITLKDPNELLSFVLQERRKELIGRGLRWADLKRLNLEGRNIILKRILDSKTYTLEPNSSLYVFPIPDNEIARSGIQQNKR